MKVEVNNTSIYKCLLDMFTFFLIKIFIDHKWYLTRFLVGRNIFSGVSQSLSLSRGFQIWLKSSILWIEVESFKSESMAVNLVRSTAYGGGFLVTGCFD
ncbi:hypothetical protein YC2023_115458 [Brassica napus]